MLLIVGFAVTVAIWPREVVSCRNFILRAVGYFLGHVASPNLPWQGLSKVHIVLLGMNGPLAAELKFRENTALVGRIA